MTWFKYTFTYFKEKRTDKDIYDNVTIIAKTDAKAYEILDIYHQFKPEQNVLLSKKEDIELFTKDIKPFNFRKYK